MITVAPIDTKNFQTLKALVLTEPTSFLDNAPYHNAKHTIAVMRNVVKLSSILELPKRETQLLVIAALFHDFQHSAKNYRQLAQSSKTSNEEHAAKHAQEIIEKLNAYLQISTEEIKEISELIKATSFAQSRFNVEKNLRRIIKGRHPDAIRERIEKANNIHRDYAPKNYKELLLCLSDVGSFLISPETAINFAIKLSREMNRKITADQFLTEQQQFYSSYLLPLKEKFISQIPENKRNQMLYYLNKKLANFNAYISNPLTKIKLERQLKAN